MTKQDYTRRNKMADVDYVVTKTINHIISECNKLAQREYKTRHN